MILQPGSGEELCAALATASTKISRVDLSRLATLVEHAPEDMVASAQAGMTLAQFQQILRLAGQWLPIDPAHAENITLGDLLAYDLSGPRRYGYGTIRDYLIGIKVALPEGQLIKAGGKVVKNVAGYDLCKLFIGARHSLGIIVEGTFKLRPLPELEIFLETRVDTLADLARLRSALLATPAEPVLIDGHNLNGPITLTIAFAGPREDVHYQASIAESLGFAQTAAPLDRQEFWNGPPPQKASVLATRTVETIMRIAPAQFLAHIGNGIIYYRGGSAPVSEPMPLKLMERVKNTYDPRRILPDYAA